MWHEAGVSELTVAPILSTMIDVNRVADMFDLLERAELSTSNCSTIDAANARNANGETMLMVAARTGQDAIVRHLIFDSDLDDIDFDGWTALLNAAYEGHVDVANLLIDAGASVDFPDLMGWSPLMWAVYKNRIDCVELLLRHKAHVNLIDEEDGLTPLIVASGRGYTNIVEQLLAHGAQVNACDKFGSTALIWAARKGHKSVVEQLLNAGAELDAIGMYASTALILATRGNFVEVVEMLLAREPNVNVTDQNGLSALSVAAREGYFEIAEMLIQSGAYVNVVDRFGNSILASAVRSGNTNIVRMLLDRHADVNARDSDNRTALHLAIDKSFTDMVLVLLEKKPNLELKNKDGETALLRAVKNRHVALCQLLVNAGAKISATDNAGDNALHLALKARSRRMTQSLLANPSDSRLLYRPNKLGQTPYSIDQNNPQPIIPLIFGPIESKTHMDTMLGYDVYSNVLADIVCEPNLTLPLTIGLYAKWGSGKSLLLAKMKDSMSTFSRNWLDGVRLTWSWSVIFSLAILTSLITLIATAAVSTTAQITIVITIPILGAIVFLIAVIFYGIIYCGSEMKSWRGSSSVAKALAKALAHFRLFLSVAMLHAPARRDKDLLTNPVSFLFADYHRLSSIGGEQALAKIVVTLFEAAENHFGHLAVRIFCALRTNYPRGNESKLRRVCGIPVILLAAICIISLMVALILLICWLLSENRLESAKGYLFGSLSLFSVSLILLIYPLYIFLIYGFVNAPKRRINSAAQRIHKLRFEGFMQKLQHEVDLLAVMIRSLDAFTSSQTRLVVVVDGLDNCEQERMVQTLDSLELLFSARANRPFIVTIAVDPHIIISAVNHSMHSALAGTELTGHDYLKNIVNMPFYLHNSAIRQLQTNLRNKRESLAEWKERFKRQDTFHGSYLSLREGADGRTSTRKATLMLDTHGLSQSLMTDDYFSNMNPRAMKRIVNALTLTGRLMRAFEIDFSWVTLGYWVSLVEQWPCRMCWLIERALDIQHDNYSLAQVYHQLKDKIPKKDNLIELDRNPDNFESFLEQASLSGPDQLTVGHIRRFVPCTSNLDPYLRKLIRERRMDLEEPPLEAPIGNEQSSISTLVGPARYLFKDTSVWSTIDVPLIEMKIEDLVKLVRKLDIDQERMETVVQRIRAANLNGLVLCTCDLAEVQQTLKLSLGDWTLLKLLIETLRNWKVASSMSEQRVFFSPALPLSTSLASIHEQKRKLTAQTEVESDHHWLMESLSGMDTIETEGDIEASHSHPASVHFDDRDVASDADSTESMCGSQENLLESASLLHKSSSLRSARLGLSLPGDLRRKMTREEMMSKVHADSIHSERSNGALSRTSVKIDDDENQLTIKRRTVDGKPSVAVIFEKNQ
uniref:NADH dehydrogenase subunit 1 n=2 Tax=Parascaris univalens TaxID=6257 RepID=A0A915BBV4_PARUN